MQNNKPTTLFNHLICILLAASILITKLSSETLASTVGECNFKVFKTGCYSSANLICDSETKQCICHPETPILIENRICVKKAKANDFCDYNEQCDNSKGFHCLTYYSSSSATSDRIIPTNCRHIRPSGEFKFKCRCLKYTYDVGLDHDEDLSFEQLQQQQQQLEQQRPQLTHDDDNNNNNNNNNNNTSNYYPDSRDTERDHRNFQTFNNIHHNNYSSKKRIGNNTAHSNQYHSILPRLVWIFLTVALIGLLALLFLIRFQSYRDARAFRQQHNNNNNNNNNHHHHQRNNRNQTEDRRSIDSELDVPPPYEIAIRMKV